MQVAIGHANGRSPATENKQPVGCDAQLAVEPNANVLKWFSSSRVIGRVCKEMIIHPRFAFIQIFIYFR